MQQMEINGQLRPVIARLIDYYADSPYEGIEIIVTSYDGNILKCSRRFEIIGEDGDGDYIYSHSAWEIETVCTLVELL